MFKIFLRKKYAIFFVCRLLLFLKFQWIFETILLFYDTLKFFVSTKWLMSFRFFNFVVFFFMQGDIDSVNNFTINFDSQNPLTLSKISTKFFDTQETFQDLYIFLEVDGLTRYCALYLAKRRYHWLSPSCIVVWSCDFVALLQKLMYQRLIDFGYLVPIENNLWSAGVTTSYQFGPWSSFPQDKQLNNLVKPQNATFLK